MTPAVMAATRDKKGTHGNKGAHMADGHGWKLLGSVRCGIVPAHHRPWDRDGRKAGAPARGPIPVQVGAAGARFGRPPCQLCPEKAATQWKEEAATAIFW